MVANFFLCRTFGAFTVSLCVREMKSNCSSFLQHLKVILEKLSDLLILHRFFLTTILHFLTDD